MVTIQTGRSSYTLPSTADNPEFTGNGNFTGTGNASANLMTGGVSADSLSGLAGNDMPIGGGGFLRGGGDGDTSVFNANPGPENIATIADFTHGIDKIALPQPVFAAAGPIGALDVAAFHSGTGAHEETDRIIHDVSCRYGPGQARTFSSAPAPTPQSAPVFSSQSCSSNLSRLVTESRKVVDQPNRISPLPASMAPNSRHLPSSTTSP